MVLMHNWLKISFTNILDLQKLVFFSLRFFLPKFFEYIYIFELFTSEDETSYWVSVTFLNIFSPNLYCDQLETVHFLPNCYHLKEICVHSPYAHLIFVILKRILFYFIFLDKCKC